MQVTIPRKLIPFALCLFSCISTAAQLPGNVFSFNCAKDTFVCADQNCITIRTTIPNIRSSTGSYVVNRLSQPEGCFRQYVSPALPGNSLGFFNDDSYSNIINLPFDFPFYSIVYNSLVVSANGYVSFDISHAAGFSHYSILSNGSGGLTALSGPGVDLPSPLYDRSLIMAPYHDLNSFSTTSPDRQIKCDIIGTAPHRKWILSYYQVPLFAGICQNLIQNTQQLVLFESTGIVEVFINSKQVCTGWNNGRAMIGMQDYTGTNGIMAPGRAASDSSWGSIDMNESWRFTPADGASLFKKVELYTISGELVTSGNTIDIGNGNYQVIFNNVCADSSKTYVMKATYKKMNDPSVEVYSADTINVIKSTTFVWTGSVSVEWENPLNWSCNTLPGSSSNVFINQGNVNISSNVTVNSITVKPGAVVNVNPGYNFSVVQQH